MYSSEGISDSTMTRLLVSVLHTTGINQNVTLSENRMDLDWQVAIGIACNEERTKTLSSIVGLSIKLRVVSGAMARPTLVMLQTPELARVHGRKRVSFVDPTKWKHWGHRIRMLFLYQVRRRS
jgi:hypothetical protein